MTRILDCPHFERCPGAGPLYDAPLCPLCLEELDVEGVDTVVEGGGTEQTPTGLRCLCGYTFSTAPDPAPAEPAPAGGRQP